MLNSHEMRKYMIARAVGGLGEVGSTTIIDAPADDPVLLQAQRDGYADYVDGQWIARGYIKEGERRTVRHISGGVSTVVG